MTNELDYLKKRVAQGKLSRRDFMGKASALGVTAAAATTMLADAAYAEGPKKGGVFKLGSVGGESTNSLDPATYASQVPFHNGRQFGETLVEVGADLRQSSLRALRAQPMRRPGCSRSGRMSSFTMARP